MANKRTVKIYWCVFALVFGSSQLLQAQNTQQIIQSINEVFLKNESYTLDLNYTVFPSYTSSKPISTSKGRFDKAGLNSRSELEGIMTVQNQKHLIVVDPLEGNISVTETSKKSLSPISLDAVDALLNNGVKTTVTKVNDKENKLTLVFGKTVTDDQTYSRIEMLYHPKSYHLSKLIFYYANETELDDEGKVTGKPRMEIIVSKFTANAKIDANVFSSNRYFVSKNKQLVAASSYANYTISDIRNKSK